MDISLIYKLTIALIPLILAITLHEFGHAWTAKKFGDSTAYLQGRVTLNPINHIDPIGTIAVPLILYLLSGFAFGWAKPVPVNTANLRKPREHGRLVTIAGPGANLIMAFMWLAILFLSLQLINVTDLALMTALRDMAFVGISINLFFMLFNLIPLLPLDGGRILQSYLPLRQAMTFEKMEPYGMFIVMGLAFLGVFSIFLRPIQNLIQGGMLNLIM